MAATVHTPPFENYFSYLRDARLRGAIAEVVLGDARLQMRSQIEQDEEEKFDVLVVDAFSSDSIPLDLLTKGVLSDLRRTFGTERGTGFPYFEPFL